MSNRANNYGWKLKFTKPQPVLKAVFHALSDHARDDTLEWTCSLRELVQWTDYSKAAIAKSLNKLERYGLIKRIRSKGKHWSTYRIQLSPTETVQVIELSPTKTVNCLPRRQSTVSHEDSLLLNPKESPVSNQGRNHANGNGNGNGNGVPPRAPAGPPPKRHGRHICGLCDSPHEWYSDDEFDDATVDLACPEFRARLKNRLKEAFR